jgi:hypothetical protein
MAEVQRAKPGQFNERELFLLELNTPEDFPDQLNLPSARFACLLVWDVTTADAAIISLLANKLLSAGAVYVCLWGTGCKRIQEAIEQCKAELLQTTPPGKIAITSGDSGDPLAEAIWHVLYCSIPDAPFAGDCNSTVGITIGAPARAADVRAAFSDPIGFSARLTHPH